MFDYLFCTDATQKTPLSTPPGLWLLNNNPKRQTDEGVPGLFALLAAGEHEATCLVLLSVTRDLPLVLMSDLPEYGLVLMRLSVFLGYNMA